MSFDDKQSHLTFMLVFFLVVNMEMRGMQSCPGTGHNELDLLELLYIGNYV